MSAGKIFKGRKSTNGGLTTPVNPPQHVPAAPWIIPVMYGLCPEHLSLRSWMPACCPSWVQRRSVEHSSPHPCFHDGGKALQAPWQTRWFWPNNENLKRQEKVYFTAGCSDHVPDFLGGRPSLWDWFQQRVKIPPRCSGMLKINHVFCHTVILNIIISIYVLDSSSYQLKRQHLRSSLRGCLNQRSCTWIITTSEPRPAAICIYWLTEVSLQSHSIQDGSAHMMLSALSLKHKKKTQKTLSSNHFFHTSVWIRFDVDSV